MYVYTGFDCVLAQRVTLARNAGANSLAHGLCGGAALVQAASSLANMQKNAETTSMYKKRVHNMYTRELLQTWDAHLLLFGRPEKSLCHCPKHAYVPGQRGLPPVKINKPAAPIFGRPVSTLSFPC